MHKRLLSMGATVDSFTLKNKSFGSKARPKSQKGENLEKGQAWTTQKKNRGLQGQHGWQGILCREAKGEVLPHTSLVPSELLAMTIPKRIVIQDASSTPVWPARFEKVAPLEATGFQDLYLRTTPHDLNLSVVGTTGAALEPLCALRMHAQA